MCLSQQVTEWWVCFLKCGWTQRKQDALEKWDQLCAPCKSIHHNNPVNGITRPIFTLYVCVCVCVFMVQKRRRCARFVMSNVTYLPKASDIATNTLSANCQLIWESSWARFMYYNITKSNLPQILCVQNRQQHKHMTVVAACDLGVVCSISPAGGAQSYSL